MNDPCSTKFYITSVNLFKHNIFLTRIDKAKFAPLRSIIDPG